MCNNESFMSYCDNMMIAEEGNFIAGSYKTGARESSKFMKQINALKKQARKATKAKQYAEAINCWKQVISASTKLEALARKEIVDKLPYQNKNKLTGENSHMDMNKTDLINLAREWKNEANYQIRKLKEKQGSTASRSSAKEAFNAFMI